METVGSAETYKVEGMSCVGCERRIEKILSRIEGVDAARASFPRSEVALLYDHDEITLDDLKDILDQEGYKLRAEQPVPVIAAGTEGIGTAERTSSQSLSVLQLLAVLGVLLAIYLLIDVTVGFNSMPAIPESAGYGLLFAVGLLTSLHCVSMCGGINLSQSVYYAGAKEQAADKIRIGGMYNLGRILAYTMVGGLAGALGSAVQPGGRGRGLMAVLSGVFMVILGLSMLGILPRLNQVAVHMPRSLQRTIGKAAAGRGPLFIGLATGLIPCGPLQAMQIYALGTGNAVRGALSMFFFSLGTVPLMFTLSAVSSLLSARFTSRMLKVSAILVLVLGIVMANRGFALSGAGSLRLPFFNSRTDITVAEIEDGVQRLTSRVLPDAYPEIEIQAGIPVIWTLQVSEEDLNSCNNEIIIPDLGITLPLKAGDNVLEFTVHHESTIPYTCWMGMITSEIHVTE